MSGKPVAALVAAHLMVGCAASDGSLTRMQGAGAGAALGAGVGALIGDSTESTLIGAAAGGLAGLAVGDAVARKKAGYASTEAMIVAERNIAARKADELDAYNAALERDIEGLDNDILALESKLHDGRSRHAASVELARRAAADLDQARHRLAEVNQEIDISRDLYEQVLATSEPVDLVEWDRRIRELERRRDELVTLIGDLEASSRRIA